MNETKLNQLFRAARKETPPGPAAGFENLVLAVLRHEPPPGALSWFDQLDALLPRLAVAVAVAVVVCLAVDFGLGALGVPNLTDGVVQISDQWLFTSTGL
jgi:hypothetical protein